MPFGFSPVPPCLKGGTGNFFYPPPRNPVAPLVTVRRHHDINLYALGKGLIEVVELATRNIIS